MMTNVLLPPDRENLLNAIQDVLDECGLVTTVSYKKLILENLEKHFNEMPLIR
jgi:hypothetical protein